MTGGVLSSLLGDAVTQVLVTSPELVVRHVTLVKRHVTSLDLPLLLQLAAILDPSQGAVRSLVRRQASSLRRYGHSIWSLILLRFQFSSSFAFIAGSVVRMVLLSSVLLLKQAPMVWFLLQQWSDCVKAACV